MKNIFAFESIEEIQAYSADIEQLNKKLNAYQAILEEEFGLDDLPKAIVWTSKENATTIFSNLPVPAFTNEVRICMSPSVQDWRAFHLTQLEGQRNERIEKYYNEITLDHVFCVLAHELTHHIQLFLDDFDDGRENSIWFEEGMCEYLSQKLTLSAAQYEELVAIEGELLELFTEKYGQHSLDEFGKGSYEAESLTAVMIYYWRSSKAIKHIVEDCHGGDIHKVFALYHEWDKAGRKVPLTEYFGVNKL
ncbi:hypothetical protein P9B03_04915 [Metasolibacillus meyeri]|uniref:DUF2268 domain-containing protein n=1 Tax=Metasolibacillus meyeri TaxID=1071052 RepID=A0AAW9NMW5_9BACL|nr:hypothetical protein [Metasolibacillus meyeri]MEC1177816.1 hypothetical protein [Metasolibacillus meyeri]